MLQSTQDSLQLYTNISVNPDALAEACGRDETATVGEFHRNKKNKKKQHNNTKEWQTLTGGRERDHNRENATNLRLHLNSCTIMHVCVKWPVV